MSRPVPALAAGLTLLLAALLLSGPPASASHSQPPGPSTSACPDTGVPRSPFTDLADSPHARLVHCAAWYGVSQGTSATTFAPTGTLRRDQLAGMVVRALRELRVQLPPAGDRFDDLGGNVHRDSVERLAAAGVVQGTAPRAFGPSGQVTRGQAASLLWRAFRLVAPDAVASSTDAFEDDDGTAHERDTNAAFGVRLVQGTVPPYYGYDEFGGPNGAGELYLARRGSYAPDRLVRRDQAARLLAVLLSKGVETGPGSTARPYERGVPVTLRDGWTLTVLGSDADAYPELLLHDVSNPPPDEDRYTVVRVRAERTGTGPARFGGLTRLQARPALSWSGATWSASGRPCGNVPDELPDPEVPPGGAVEGNLCFDHDIESYDEGPSGDLRIVDLAWGRPTLPHLSRLGDGTLGGLEASPYRTPSAR